ncbi:alpha/beta hydrolase [Streptomyces sp. NPDC050504]|uniref:alpha/beta hydrolase n=1 Tax=Streptomyces sp. NPDC050504 TaxID=3365618 RepID=UPI00379E8E31
MNRLPEPPAGDPYGAPYEAPYGSRASARSEARTQAKSKTWRRVRGGLIGITLLGVGAAGGVVGHMAYEKGYFERGEPVTFGSPKEYGSGQGAGKGDKGGARASGDADKTQFPTGPEAEFKTQNSIDDGTKIAYTTLDGKKSGFKGKVWVWAPKQYFEKKYERSGFPVLIALPGGNGYPNNYWMGTDLKLQSSIAKWSKEGASLPFIVVMPVLNPDDRYYYDGSDIPGQPKMGTWMTEDVPDFVRANFRTFKSRDGWAFMGSSSGGFVGLKSVLKHPDKFKAVIASGPDTVPDSPLWKGHEAEREANNPEKLAAALGAKPQDPAKDVYLAFQVGSKESGVNSLRKFSQTYGKGRVKTRLNVIPDGEHNAKTYVGGMAEGSIQWISEHMQGPIASE